MNTRMRVNTMVLATCALLVSVGQAAVHTTEAELFYVVEGAGTLVTGGKLVDEKRSNAENASGTGITGGQSRAVAKGDGFHVVGLKPPEVAPIVARLRRDRPEPEFTISARTGWDPQGMDPGLKNPLGARAMYLFDDKGHDTQFRLHGTPEWASIGTAASSGCIRLMNQDVIDLYSRVRPGKTARVVVL